MSRLVSRGRTKSGSYYPVPADGAGSPTPHASPQRSILRHVWVMSLIAAALWVTMQVAFSTVLRVRTKEDNLPPSIETKESRARAANRDFAPNRPKSRSKDDNRTPRQPKHMELLNRRPESKAIADLPVEESEDLVLVGGIRTWGCHLNNFPLIFYHVPKTGGGTVRSLLRKYAKQHNHEVPICWQCTFLPQGPVNNCLEKSLDGIGLKCRDKLPARPKIQRQAMKAWTEGVVMGHYNLGIEYAVWPAAGPREANRVVQLRDPLERMKSLFIFSEFKKEDFVDYVQRYDRVNAMELSKKLQVPETKVKGLSLAIIRVCGQTCPGLLASGQMTSREALERAKSNLRTQFTVVGVSEEMELFFKMLGRRFHYLSGMENLAGDELIRHKADQEVKESVTQLMKTDEVIKAVVKSSVLQAESELYEVAVQVMKAQWAELEKCPVDTLPGPEVPSQEGEAHEDEEKEEEEDPPEEDRR